VGKCSTKEEEESPDWKMRASGGEGRESVEPRPSKIVLREKKEKGTKREKREGKRRGWLRSVGLGRISIFTMRNACPGDAEREAIFPETRIGGRVNPFNILNSYELGHPSENDRRSSQKARKLSKVLYR